MADGPLVALPLRNETLVYPVAELEAIRVVEPNEPIARVQDRRTRTVVASQHDLATARVAPLELQNVADRGAAKLVYRLVVVADHDHIPVRGSQQLDEFRLSAVGVLELVDEDVTEAPLEFPPGGRRLAQQPQTHAHLVAEIDEAGSCQQLLVAREGSG